ncbi:MAG: iron-containing alcohol dehydrogenase [Candidatus Lokiarchaeota archaeon]|nr:iron-containing alcohol dehydrogenase [Candidatus Lokiarchaeota archaeon]
MWYFYSPNIIYGEDSLGFIENIKGNKCYIITDKNIEDLGYLKILTEKLEKFGKEFQVFNEVIPDPREEGVLKARKQCNVYSPDLIIALGGGSVIDTAKTAWVLYEFPELNIGDIHLFRSDLNETGKKAKFIAIPTTSGTGSEATNGTIISRLEDDIWKKFIYAHRGITPTYAIVDPIFPKGMPPNLTVDTAFDALSHAIEGMVSNWKNEFSNGMGLKAIELIFKYLPIVYKDGKNIEARDYLHQAATMAGLAFSNSQVHIGHGMGHSWGAVFHTHHGRTVGILLPYVSQFCLNNPDKDDDTLEIYAKIAKQLGWAKWDDDDKKAAFKAVDKIKELQKKVDFPSKLQDLGVSKTDFENNIEMLVACCFQDATSVMTPRSITDEYYRKIYYYAYEGKDIDF